METGFTWQRPHAHGPVSPGVVVGCNSSNQSLFEIDIFMEVWKVIMHSDGPEVRRSGGAQERCKLV